jgi:hypothetical protein
MRGLTQTVKTAPLLSIANHVPYAELPSLLTSFLPTQPTPPPETWRPTSTLFLRPRLPRHLQQTAHLAASLPQRLATWLHRPHRIP